MASSSTASNWQQREQEAVQKLLESLPQWTGSLDDDAPLPRGTKTRTGVLPESGLTYYWRRNDEPRDRVELVIAVRAGSIDETDDERGLAHVLEHLAFRARTDADGTRWSALRELEAHGVSFGAHQNAYTSFEETVFFLHVPADFFGRALELLAALVGEAAHVDASDVDAERKIVLEEWRQGKDWAQRSTELRRNQPLCRVGNFLLLRRHGKPLPPHVRGHDARGAPPHRRPRGRAHGPARDDPRVLREALPGRRPGRYCLCGNQTFTSCRPPRHRRDVCSMAWRAPDTLVDFHTGYCRRRGARRGPGRPARPGLRALLSEGRRAAVAARAGGLLPRSLELRRRRVRGGAAAARPRERLRGRRGDVGLRRY